ncbi:MAG: AAA family ATPase [Dethiobacteria bacterium]|nr:AAA family ATPase [Bacillota bacterium]MDW7729228.1 AAA family ATPase [Bacillota bacterium]
MTKRIAVAGKGGTGKTTLSALLIRYLIENHPGKSILAVDADANANLNEALGVKVHDTIGTILEDTKKPNAVPTGMTKDIFIEYRLSQAMVEEDAFDLLVMGNPQGPGCYCYPNDLLKSYLEKLSKNYDFMVIDNEAGLEHLSRRLLPMIDLLLVTSDSTARGVRSAGRVKDIVEKVQIAVSKMGLVIGRSREGDITQLKQEVENSGLELFGEIIHDPLVAEYDLNAKALFRLPEDSPAVQTSKTLFKGLNL